MHAGDGDDVNWRGGDGDDLLYGGPGDDAPSSGGWYGATRMVEDVPASA